MESPCVKICVYDPARLVCSGCGRTLNEIADWMQMSDEARRDVMAQLPKRLEKLKSD